MAQKAAPLRCGLALWRACWLISSANHGERKDVRTWVAADLIWPFAVLSKTDCNDLRLPADEADALTASILIIHYGGSSTSRKVEVLEPARHRLRRRRPQPQRVIRLARGPGCEVKIFGYPEHKLRRELSRLAAVDLRVGTPPIYHYRDLIFSPAFDALYDRSGQRVDETCTRMGPSLVVESSDPQVIRVPPTRPRFDRPVVFIGPLSSQWGEFLTWGISRLWPIAEGGLVPGEAGFVGPKFRWREKGVGKFIDTFLRYAGVDESQIVLPQTITELSDVYIPHPSFSNRGQAFTSHFSVPSRIADNIVGNEVVRKQLEAAPPVYLSRSLLAERRQRLGNEELIEEILRARGVQIVHPERLNFEDQIKLVNSHTTFLGLIGSAFHSLVFSRLDERVTTKVLVPLSRRHDLSFAMIDLLKGVQANYFHSPIRVGRKGMPEAIDATNAMRWLRDPLRF